MRIVGLYLKLLNKQPILANSLTFGGLMGFGDLICQTFIERKVKVNAFFASAPENGAVNGAYLRNKCNIDLMRTARFVTIGTCYYGPAVTVWYRCLDMLAGRILRSSSKKKMGLLKMVIDQVCKEKYRLFNKGPCYEN